MIKYARLGGIAGTVCALTVASIGIAPVAPVHQKAKKKPAPKGMFAAPGIARKVAKEASSRVSDPALDLETPTPGPFTPSPAAKPPPPPALQAPRYLTTKDLVNAFGKNPTQAEKQFEGVIVTGGGKVERIQHLDRWTMVTVKDPQSKDRFVYRWIYAAAPHFEVGEKVKLTAVFDFRDVDGHGRKSFNLDVARADPKTPASPGEKTDILRSSLGWQLKGFVGLARGFVAVFKKKDRGTLYASQGQELEKGVLVSQMSGNFVTLRVAGKPVTMAP